MKTYQYIDHKENKMIYQCTAKDILEADKLFLFATGINVATQPHIGCYSPDWGK